ncbi:MAG: hydrogenase small subunit [Proteobacteria bacterium]|nr:hydrogenase small subunit [Pseudomonadota bacterium]
MIRGKNIFVENEVGRRDFLKLSTKVATVLGLSPVFIPKISHAMQAKEKPAVIWLHFQECTGCTESLLRAEGPDLAQVILDVISLEYHETLFAAAGHQIEDNLHKAMKRYKGKYVLVVEGAIPKKMDGAYCQIAGKTAIDMLNETAKDCAAIVAIGSCATWGGIPSSGPNPTGAVGVSDIIKDKPIVNIPGCPPSPYNFLSTVVHYLLFNKIPTLDEEGRPMFAYGRLIHDQCERRGHFDSGRFANAYGDEGHRKGYCLYKLGCKGPSTFGNCPEIGFNREKTWPVNVGHPCFGCIESKVGFNQSIHEISEVLSPNPPQTYANIGEASEKPVGAIAAGVVGAAVGAVGAAVVTKAKSLPGEED